MRPWLEQAEALAKKDDSYLLNQLESFKDTWLEAEEDLLTPLKQFLKGNQKQVYDQVKTFEMRYGDEFADLPGEHVAPLRNLLTSERPYAGGLIPQANNAMAEMQKQLEQRLQQAQADALQAISEQEARLTAEVLAPTTAAKADVHGATKPGTALLRVNRYRTEEVPRQLQWISALAMPAGAEEQTPITVVAASTLKPQCPLSQISNEAELQQWLEALARAARKELEQGHRISL